MHKGVQPKFIDLEDKLYEFFEFNRKLGNAVTIKALILQMIKLDEENINNKNKNYFGIKNDNFHTNYTHIERFMDRKGLSIRQATGMGRKFYSNTYMVIGKNINNVLNYYLNYGQDLSLVCNMDETPIFFNMPSNKTIEIKGKKTVQIVTQNQEKMRVSLILAVLADGTKLPPYIIFKGNNSSTILTKEISNLPHVKNKEIFYAFNINAWTTGEIVIDWLNKVWFEYLKNFDSMFESLLIIDKATTHENEEFKRVCFNNDVTISYIPKGRTSILQPLDVSINKPFNDALRNEYTQFCIQKGLNNADKISRKQIIDIVYDVWNNKNIITKEMIIKSFKITGLSNKIDSSENYFFEVFKWLDERKVDKIEVIKDESDSDLEIDPDLNIY